MLHSRYRWEPRAYTLFGMIHTIFHPRELPADVHGAQVVVLDVLRATSTMVTALAAGARELRLYDSLDGARHARRQTSAGPVVLAGEQNCRKPEDFDLGNSPREFVTERVGNAVILLATTNGTRAAVAAQRAGAQTLLAGALLNATATARALLPELDARDTLLLCAGTNGASSLEDVLGAGAILFGLLQATYRTNLAFTDTSWMAYHAFTAVRPRLSAALRLGQGGINVINAGLDDDIDHCGRLDALPVVATMALVDQQLTVRRSG
jgi:2-phosphosulfolactate phosphatase